MPLPPDPSLKDFQYTWESQFWHLKRASRNPFIFFYEQLMQFFGAERKPRDIFRADVAEYREWLRKKGYSEGSVNNFMHKGARLYRLLDEYECIEAGFNPFTGMAPRRIR